MAKKTKNKKYSIPPAIRILGAVYEIHIVPELIKDENIHGDCDSEKRIIRINQTDDEEMLAILFHESIHAVFAETGIQHLLTLKLEETIVSVLEKAFRDVVDLTPKFITYKDLEESSNDKPRISSRKRTTTASGKRVSTGQERKCSRVN